VNDSPHKQAQQSNLCTSLMPCRSLRVQRNDCGGDWNLAGMGAD